MKDGRLSFTERHNLPKLYRKWLKEENKKHAYTIPEDPETFLAFLEIAGYRVFKAKEGEVDG